jgi:lysophospholipase
MEKAPFHHALAEGPTDAVAHWLKADDGIRIRVAAWPKEDAKGTVLIFPGRTEFNEKYGRAAEEFAKRGYAALSIDWRGQGLADRLLPDRGVGHVGEYSDYQLDVTAAVDHARALGLPEPFHLMGHSMGGCIGLRALFNGLPVASASFSAPMWGIQLSPFIRPFAWAMSSISHPLGFSTMLSPGQSTENYLFRTTLAENALTNDAEFFEYLKRQIAGQPELGLGGPSLHWLNRSMKEMNALAALPSPAQACVTFLGTAEEIVCPDRIRARMARWTNGDLVVVPTGRHEMLMDAPEMRDPIFDQMTALFDKHG